MTDRTAPQPDSEGWIDWKGGGECPVHEDTILDLRFNDGQEILATAADGWRWNDIIAYRPVSPAQEVEPSAPVAAIIEDLRVAQTDDFIARITALEAENAALREREADRRRARPLAEWHDDIGPVLWWAFPIEEAPFVGDPRGDDWPGYHTHWTPLRNEDCPVDPRALLQGQEPAGTVGDGR